MQQREKGLKNTGLNWSQILNSVIFASSMFHHLSYRANWELAVMWIHDKPMDSGYNYVCDVMNA